MTTATEILSQIFDKDGIKYRKTELIQWIVPYQ